MSKTEDIGKIKILDNKSSAKQIYLKVRATFDNYIFVHNQF